MHHCRKTAPVSAPWLCLWHNLVVVAVGIMLSVETLALASWATGGSLWAVAAALVLPFLLVLWWLQPASGWRTP